MADTGSEVSAASAIPGAVPHDEDFTERHYAEILDEARRRYVFATFDAIPWDERFVLWRHDIDISLNRSRRIAEIEADRGIVSTYFANVHSAFYNLFEASQSAALSSILAMGHRLGIHFDANYYDVQNEDELEILVAREANLLSTMFDSRIDAVSFHNPTDLHLGWTRERYAGLVNCYSKRLKESTSYCSDSNGYWRFRRLFDVVKSGDEIRLQVLTHPGLWQSQPMAARQRVFRAVMGRANATLAEYDKVMKAASRVNLTGQPAQFVELLEAFPENASFWDYLWNTGRLESLLVELQRAIDSFAHVSSSTAALTRVDEEDWGPKQTSVVESVVGLVEALRSAVRTSGASTTKEG